MRKLCWWAGSCSAAIFISVYLLPEKFLLPAGMLCAAGTLLSLLFSGAARRRLRLAALGLAFGFIWTGCYTYIVRQPARSLISDDVAKYTMEVTDYPRETSRGASLSVRLRSEGLPGARVQLYTDQSSLSLIPGDLISCMARLSGSDLLRGESVDYYEAKGIYLLGYAQHPVQRLASSELIPLRYLPQYVAKTLKESVAQIFPEDVSGFLVALITGDKSALPPGTYAAFQRSGLSHVVAVSGLHISFLAGLLTTLLGKRSRLSALIGIPMMLFFAAAVGSTPSALRAALMCTLLMIAPLVGRETDKPTTLAVTLTVLLLPCPYAAASISLQLSFGAVAGIYLISGDLSARWLDAVFNRDRPPTGLPRKALVFLIDSLSVTLGALLFTTPLAALYFRSVSLAGPVANLLTLWAVSGTFLGGLAAGILGLFITPLGAAVAWLIAWPARWILFVARWLARLPFSSVSLLSGYLVLWFIVAYVIFILWFLGRKQVRITVPFFALALTLCAALVSSIWPMAAGSLTVAALDVGQGSSTLFYSQGQTLLVDCGGNSADDPGDIAADYIQSLGSSHLDVLVLTHYHTDHAGGVPELLARLDVSLLLLPDVTPEEPLRREILASAERFDCEVKLLSDYFALPLGNTEVKIYPPLGDGGANEEGLSLLCSTKEGFDVLVTGDMNSVIEKRLIKYNHLPDIELLVVGHHGSAHSTCEELLWATRPDMAVISSGYNSYGHPAPQTLERLGAAGCDIYLTDWMGTVTFTVRGDQA